MSVAVEPWLQLVRIGPPENGPAPARSSLTCWRRATSVRCAPRLSPSSPSSRASTGRSRCSRRPCTSRNRGLRVQCRLAWATRFKKGFAGGLEHAHAALELADELDDDALRVEALAILTFLGCAVGDPQAPAHATRAHDLATAIGDPVLLDKANGAIADVLDVRRSVEEARALLERSYGEWHERDELLAAGALDGLAYVELWGNRWQLAAEYANRAYELHVQYGLEVPWIHLPIAVIAAHRGQLELARAHSERSLQLGEEQIGLHTPVHLGTLGVVALQDGDPHTALGWFGRSEATTTRLGWGEAGKRWWVPDHVEALLALDRPDDAERILDAWEADARRLERDWVLAHVTRCRGLMAAARGDVSEAASLLENAVTEHETVGDAFGRARALLALGVVRRRERQKRAAREAIGAALGEFERLGAATWIEKARAELGRIGGRTREEGLTAAERRVAALVAEGRTNKEVAAALLLGERTVETHLSHVYAKLGVRSRAQLARRFRPDEQSSGEPTISSCAPLPTVGRVPSHLQQRRHSDIEIGPSRRAPGGGRVRRRRARCRRTAADAVRARRQVPCRDDTGRLLEHGGPVRDRPGRPWRHLRSGELRQQVPRRGGRVHGHRPRRDV